MSSMLDKLPPQNLEAEQSVLGSMLLEKDAVDKATEILEVEDFYRDAHKQIFTAMLSLSEDAEAIDVITVVEQLKQKGNLDKVGGISYISELANSVPNAANVEYYCKIVEEKSLLRKLLGVSTDISRHVYEGGYEVEDLLDIVERQVFDVSQGRSTVAATAIKDVLMETFEQIDYLYMNKGNVIGVPTGLTDLDELTSGFHASELIILAARPSQGKTALSLNIAMGAAREGVPVGIFSLEMSKEQLAQRMLSSEAGVNGQRLRTGYLSDEDWPKLSRALGRLSESPIYIDDSPNISIMELRSKARRLKAEHNIGFLLIDYLQLMHTKGKSENRQQEISEISRSLKALARELKIPVLALSQLSRAVEQRQDRKPQLSDLRESGAIEQDADVVLFIYPNPEGDNPNIVELIIAKQRNGPTGGVKTVFLKDIGRFVNLDKRYKSG